MLQICIGALPALVSVKALAELVHPTAWSPKSQLVGARLTAVPTPVSTTRYELPTASPAITTDDFLGPPTVGVKVTLIMQLALAARLFGDNGQLWVNPKSSLFPPAMPTLLMDKAGCHC